MSAANTNPNTMVVADDNPDAALALAEVARILGYEPVVASDGKQALEACAAERPAVAILDVEMPVMDGCKAARRMRELPNPPRLIASLSGVRLDEEPLRSRCAVFDARLSKPLDFDQLAALLEAARQGAAPSDPAAGLS